MDRLSNQDQSSNENSSLKSDFGLPFSLTLGLAIGISMLARLFNGNSWKPLDFSFIWSFDFFLAFSASLLSVFPLYYLMKKGIEYREKTKMILEKVNSIETSLKFEISKIIHEIDHHEFKRDSLMREQLQLISGNRDNSFRKNIFRLLYNWKENIIDDKRELWRIVYERILLGLISSEKKQTYYISLREYLDLLLNIIDFTFRIEGKFIYASYTNALPDSWFEGNVFCPS